MELALKQAKLVAFLKKVLREPMEGYRKNPQE